MVNGGIIYCKKLKCVDIIDPHRMRVAIEHQPVLTFRVMQRFKRSALLRLSALKPCPNFQNLIFWGLLNRIYQSDLSVSLTHIFSHLSSDQFPVKKLTSHSLGKKSAVIKFLLIYSWLQFNKMIKWRPVQVI